MKKIYLAGGCFWGMEELFRQQLGVVSTEVGYSGGKNDNPTYEFHPGHAEALKISFDESQTDYSRLLDFFFRIHDPTTVNQQGNDIGESYRSVIFFETNQQKVLAEKMIKKVDQSKLFNSPVATKLEKFSKFWSAEDYHQNYLQKNPGGYTCHFVRSNNSIA